MAISKVDTGVFLVSPDKVDFKNSLAYEYASAFTKGRHAQWELAQKQQLMQMELGAKRFAAEMEFARQHLKDVNDHNTSIDLRVADIKEGRLKAQDAATIEAMKEAGRRQRTLADWEAKRVETRNEPKGGRSESSGGGGSRGRSGLPAGNASLSDVEQAEIGGAVSVRDNKGGQTSALSASDLKRRRTSGSLVATTAEDVDIQNAALIDNLVTQRTTSTADRDEVLADVLTELVAAGHGDFAESYSRLEAARKAAQAGGGGTPRESKSFNYGGRSVPKYPKLGELPAAPAVGTPAIANDQAAIDALLAMKLSTADVKMPTMPMTDFIIA